MAELTAEDDLIDQVMDLVDEVLREQESASPMRWDCAHGAYGVAVALVEKFQVTPR